MEVITSEPWLQRRCEEELCSSRTIMRAWVLVLLHGRPAHGYDIINNLTALGAATTASRVYRALKWLETAQLVKPDWETGRGPARRIYTAGEDATCVLEIMAPTLRQAAARVDPRMSRYVNAVLDDMAAATRGFTFTLRATVTVDASNEGSARWKLDQLFGAERAIDLDVRSTGEVEVDELVQVASRGTTAWRRWWDSAIADPVVTAEGAGRFR